jgi:muconolactone delta-isomerase
VEFLVEFEIAIPDDASASEVRDRDKAEAAAAERLVEDGHLVRVWKLHDGTEGSKVLGLYRADSEIELRDLLGALPLYEWMRVKITALEQHPNDPASRPTA